MMPSAISPSPPPSSWTFTQGFLLGQASFLIILLLFIRYVVFSPAEPPDEDDWKKRRIDRAKRSKLSTTGVPSPPPSQILGKTGYDMATHPAESTDWINVLFAQVLQGYRNDLLSEGGEEGARQRIEKWLNPENSSMSWLDPIQVTALSLGTSYPLLSHARIRPSDGQGHIRAEIDVDFLDSVSLSVSTSVLINLPRPRFAVLPVALGVELVSIGGTLSLEIHDPLGERQHLHACLLPDFHLNLKTSTLLGSRAKLQDIPKLEQLILSRLRSVLQDRIVHPHHLTLALPRLLSPSVSPTPIINDIGEGAVNAMSDAIRKGVGQMVDNFAHSGGDDAIQWGPSPSPSPPSPTYLDDNNPHLEPPAPPRESVLLSPGLGTGQRKIPMPAGFPGMPSSPTPSTPPLFTPQAYPSASSLQPSLEPSLHPSHPSQSLMRQSTVPPATTQQVPGAFTTAIPPSRLQKGISGISISSNVGYTPGSGLAGDGALSASAGGVGGGSGGGHGGSQFRFRGQFASQPPTPGGSGYGKTGGVGGVGGVVGTPSEVESRRMGVLNSRAS